ncbi:hypothetical protein KKC06_04385 [Patescibacteria group bacterium]|nr:hypothetical protein [Patescibacteria group bacterium]
MGSISTSCSLTGIIERLIKESAWQIWISLPGSLAENSILPDKKSEKTILTQT